VLSHTNNGDPQVAIGFEITQPPSLIGRQITYYGSLAATVISKGKNEGRKVAELTLDALDVCGWDGVGFAAASLASCVGNEASIVVAHEEDDRGTRVRVKFINPPNSLGAAVKDRLNDSEAANVTKQFQALLAKRKQQAANRPKPAAATKRTPPPNAGDAWEPEPAGGDEFADL
jgi:hypothetical protein